MNKKIFSSFNIFYIGGAITIIMATIFLFYIFYLLVFPFKTIEYKNQPFPIIGKEFHPGDVVPFTVDYCRYITGYSYTIAGIEDGIVSTLGTKSVISIPGCRTMVSRFWRIPLNTAKGRYRLVFVSEFHISAIRIIDVTSETQMFTVM